MIGQEKLLEKFNTFTLDTLPHSIILEGDFGSGRHTIIKYLADRLNLSIEPLNENMIKLATIREAQSNPNPCAYIIDGETITEKQEGVLLKFLEEPSPFAFIFILCPRSSMLLDTIINRCQIFTMGRYSRKTIQEFCGSIGYTPDENLLSVCDTPGKVVAWKDSPVEEINVLCCKILTVIKNANLSNALSISERIRFPLSKTEETKMTKKELEEYNQKYNLDLFMSCLINQAAALYKEGKIHSSVYSITDKFITNSKVKFTNVKNLFEAYLCELKLNKN